jgi:hypothetical protein
MGPPAQSRALSLRVQPHWAVVMEMEDSDGSRKSGQSLSRDIGWGKSAPCSLGLPGCVGRLLPAPHPEHARRTILLCLGSLSLHADEG